jgi:hypothetical protein
VPPVIEETRVDTANLVAPQSEGRPGQVTTANTAATTVSTENVTEERSSITDLNQCQTCMKHYTTKKILKKHIKHNSGNPTQCLKTVCSKQHTHEYIIEKFDSAESAQAFGSALAGKFFKKYGGKNDTITMNCTESLKKNSESCPAKYVVTKENIHQNENQIEIPNYILRGCTGHNHHVVQGADKEFPSLCAARAFIREEELDSIYRLKDIKHFEARDYFYYQCRRAGSHDAKKKSTKKGGCKGFFTLKASESGHTTFQGNFDHNHPQGDLMVISDKQRDEIKELLENDVAIGPIMARLEGLSELEQTKGRQPLVDDICRFQRLHAPGTIDL